MFVPSRLLRASKGAETSMFKNSLPKGEVNSAGPRGSPLCGLSLKGGPAAPQLQGLNHPAFGSFISKMQILFRSENSLGPWLHLTSGQASPADKLGCHGWHARLTPPVSVTDMLVMCFWKRGFLNYLSQASLSTATCLSAGLLYPSGNRPPPTPPIGTGPLASPGAPRTCLQGPVLLPALCWQPGLWSQVAVWWQLSLLGPRRGSEHSLCPRNRAAPLALEAV